MSPCSFPWADLVIEVVAASAVIAVVVIFLRAHKGHEERAAARGVVERDQLRKIGEACHDHSDRVVDRMVGCIDRNSDILGEVRGLLRERNGRR